MSLTPDQIARRTLIGNVWREANGHGDSVELFASDKEWAFFEALLMAGSKPNAQELFAKFHQQNPTMPFTEAKTMFDGIVADFGLNWVANAYEN